MGVPSSAAAVGKSAMMQPPPAAPMGKGALMQPSQAPAMGKSTFVPAATTGKSAAMARAARNGNSEGGGLPKSRTWDSATGKYVEEDIPADLQELMSGSW